MDFANLIGIIGFFVMLILVLFGVPIFIAMMIPAFIGFWLIGGTEMLVSQLTYSQFNITASYSWAVVPLFILMGELAGHTNVAQVAYQSIYKWLGNIRGGILMATVGGNALFGACSGVPVSGIVIFTRIAWPEIQRFKLHRGFSLSCIACGGILATLIPPSIPIVILCVLVNISVGRTLIAGIIPALITAAAFMLVVWVTGKLKPEMLPVIPMKSSWTEKVTSVFSLWPIFAIFILIMGGIYLGLFSPTVGGGIGATGLIIYALAKRTKFKEIIDSFWSATIINAQLFPIVIGGFVFGRFMGFSGLANALSDFITASNLPPLLIMTVIMLFYLAAGCIGETMAMLIITLPIFFPLAVSLGFDPYAFAIILVFMIGLGGITPPIGLSIFTISSLARVRPTEIYKGVLPFFLVQLALCWLFLLVPELVTWLPDLLYK